MVCDLCGDTIRVTLAAGLARREPMRRVVQKIWRDQSGASAVEYGLLLAFIAVVLMVAVKLMSANISSNFEITAAELDSTPP